MNSFYYTLLNKNFKDNYRIEVIKSGMKPFSHSKINNISELRLTGVFLLATLFLLISTKGSGQLIADFSASRVSICSGSGVIFTDNSTGTSVSTTYSWNFGSGASPAVATGEGPHIVTYTGSGTSTVSLTIIDKSSDTEIKTDYITVIPLPTEPIVGAINHPTCTSSTGSVVLDGLPATGTWAVTRYPGTVTTIGTGSSATISGLSAGTYNYAVTNSTGCLSPQSANVVIPEQPAGPTAPTVGTITPPTCTLSTGSVVLSALPAGNWTITRIPGGVITTGNEAAATISNLPEGTFNFTVTREDGCVSPLSLNVVITAQPPSPSSPAIAIDCSQGFGRAKITVTSPTGPDLEYRLDGGTYQSETLFTDVANGSHTISVRNASGCTTTGSTFEVSCDCLKGPTVTLSSTSGSTCGTLPETVSGNTFGGSATRVTVTENGAGSVSQTQPNTKSPFAFTYTPAAGDAGKSVIITVQTDNPLGSPCAAAIATYTLMVNANPAAPIVGTITQPTCSVSTGLVVLNGLPSVGTWTLTRNPGAVTTTGNGTSRIITGLAAGTYTYRITDAAGCISVPSADVAINAQPATPTAPVVGAITQPTCTVGTGSVVLNGLPSGTWTINPGGITGSTTSIAISELLEGTYPYTVTNSAGCTSVTPSDVVINAQPATPTAPIVDTIIQPTCTVGTGSVVLSGLPSGTWTINPGGITGSTTSIAISELLEGTYPYTVTNSAGCTSVTPSDVVINAQPATPTAPIVDTIIQPTCTVGTGSVVLSGLPSGTWTINPGGITGSTTSKAISGLIEGTYTYTVTNSGGCTSVASANVVINAQPVVTTTPPTVGTITPPTCTLSTGSVVLNGLPATGTWTLTRYPGTVTSTGTGTSTTISGLSAGTYNFAVTNAGCLSAPSANVVIPAQPATPTLIITDPAAVCSPLKVDLTAPSISAGSTPGLTFTYWTNAAATIGYTTPTQAGTGTYYIKGTTTSGCFDIKPVTVTVNLLPTANAGTGGNNCGFEFYLDASLNTGTGTWSKVSGPGNATFSPDANTANALVAVTAFGSYSFRWTVVNGACSNSATVTVTFIQQPPANAGTGGHECDKDFVFNAVAPTGTGTWTKINGPGNTVFTPDNHRTNAKVTVDQFGTYDFAWSVVSSNCTSNDIVRVVFQDLPSINAGIDTAICKGGNIQLHALGTGSFAWVPAALVSNPNIMDPVATPVTTTTFKVNLTDQFGCKNSDDIIVEVREKPVPNSGPDQVLEYMFVTTMNAQLARDNETGIWSLISGTGKFFNASDAKSSLSQLSVGKNVFLWTVTNRVCPASGDTVTIIVHDIVISTLITPNMDGKNDYFILKGLSNLGKTELEIFDRRGAQVYKNVNYNNLWNGVDYNGNPLPDDTYFYVMRTEKGRSKTGFIVIRR